MLPARSLWIDLKFDHAIFPQMRHPAALMLICHENGYPASNPCRFLSTKFSRRTFLTISVGVSRGFFLFSQAISIVYPPLKIPSKVCYNMKEAKERKVKTKTIARSTSVSHRPTLGSIRFQQHLVGADLVLIPDAVKSREDSGGRGGAGRCSRNTR